MQIQIQILNARDYMTPDDQKRMAELKAEYLKLTTRPSRMREIHAEMVALRVKTVGR